jgi:hypothetical protein
MAITPDNASDSLIARLFGDELKAAEATAKAMDRINELMRPAPNAETLANGRSNEIDLRGKDLDIRYEYHGAFRGKQHWSCWDHRSYDGEESAIGSGESKEDALVDLMDKIGAEAAEPEPMVRTVKLGNVVAGNGNDSPLEYSEPRYQDPDEDDGVTFDSDLEDARE